MKRSTRLIGTLAGSALSFSYAPIVVVVAYSF